MKLYKQYDAIYKALTQLLLGAVDAMFIRSLRNRYIGYANIITLKLLSHIYRIYAKINTADLEEYSACMKETYNCNIPIEDTFDQIIDDASGNAPFTPVQVVTHNIQRHFYYRYVQ